MSYTAEASTTKLTVNNRGSVYESSETATVADRNVVKDVLRTSKADVTGWRNPLPYFASETKRVYWKGKFITVVGGTWYMAEPFVSQSNRVPSFNAAPITVPASFEQVCITGALNNLKSQNVNYSLFLAELHKSQALVVSTLQDLAKALSAARRRDWRAVCRALRISEPSWRSSTKDVSKRWLEVQYGWKPLLADLYGAVKDYDPREWDPRVTVKYSRQQDLSQGAVRPLDWPDAITGLSGTRNGFMKGKIRLDYNLELDKLQSLKKVGLTNPTVIAWELVPWSFVIDWLIPIGDWLSSFDSTVGLSFRGGSYTTVVFVKEDYNVNYTDLNNSWNGLRVMKASASCSVFSFRRKIYDTSPRPTLYFKNPFSVVHGLNALALLRGLKKS